MAKIANPNYVSLGYFKTKFPDNKKVIDNNKTLKTEVEKNKTNQEQINVSKSVQDEMEKFGMPEDWRNNQEIVKKLYADNKKLFFKWTTLEIFDYTKTINTIDDLINFNDDFIKILRDIYLNGLPKSSGKDNNIVEKIINNKTNYDAFVNIKNKPEFQDYNVFEENVTFEYISTLQTMNEKCPESWCKNNDIINKISHNKSILDNIDILKKKNIQIEDFKVFEKLCSYKQKYPDVSFDNIDNLLNDYKDEICKILKNEKDLSETQFNVLLGNFNNVINIKDIKNSTGLSTYLNNSNKYFNEVTNFTTNQDLKKFLTSKLENTLKNKVKDIGEAILSEYIAYNIINSYKAYVIYKNDNNIKTSRSSFIFAYIKDKHNLNLFQKCVENGISAVLQPSLGDLKDKEFKRFTYGFCISCISGIDWISLFSSSEDDIKFQLEKSGIDCLVTSFENIITSFQHSFIEDLILQTSKEFLNEGIQNMWNNHINSIKIENLDKEIIKNLKLIKNDLEKQIANE